MKLSDCKIARLRQRVSNLVKRAQNLGTGADRLSDTADELNTTAMQVGGYGTAGAAGAGAIANELVRRPIEPTGLGDWVPESRNDGTTTMLEQSGLNLQDPKLRGDRRNLSQGIIAATQHAQQTADLNPGGTYLETPRAVESSEMVDTGIVGPDGRPVMRERHTHSGSRPRYSDFAYPGDPAVSREARAFLADLLEKGPDGHWKPREEWLMRALQGGTSDATPDYPERLRTWLDASPVAGGPTHRQLLNEFVSWKRAQPRGRTITSSGRINQNVPDRHAIRRWLEAVKSPLPLGRKIMGRGVLPALTLGGLATGLTGSAYSGSRTVVPDDDPEVDLPGGE